MHTRTLINLTLLLVLLGLGALAVFEPGKGPQAPVRLLTDLAPDQVTRLRVTTSRGETISLRRDEQSWRFDNAGSALVNPAEVANLLAILTLPSRGGFRAAGNDLSKFGLQPPLAKLEVDNSYLVFGSTEPLNGYRYVMYDEEVHLVDDLFARQLRASRANYVHPAPLGPGTTPVAFQLPEYELHWLDGKWQLTPPEPDIETETLNAFAEAWKTLKAVRVEPYSAGEKWTAAISIQLLGHPSALEFQVAITDYEMILGSAPTGVQYHVIRSSGEQLLDQNQFAFH